nr:YopX family protein [uncultured Trichococcus sp.]
MNDIKFRGNGLKGEWKYGLLTFMFSQYAIVDPIDENSVHLIDKKTVGQYTRIKGAGDRRIYDGDIVRLRERTINGTDITHICRVYQKGNGMWMAEGHPEHNRSYRTRLPLFPYRHKAEVIGNVYDNPELLEVCR